MFNRRLTILVKIIRNFTFSLHKKFIFLKNLKKLNAHLYKMTNSILIVSSLLHFVTEHNNVYEVLLTVLFFYFLAIERHCCIFLSIRYIASVFSYFREYTNSVSFENMLLLSAEIKNFFLVRHVKYKTIILFTPYF